MPDGDEYCRKKAEKGNTVCVCVCVYVEEF